MWLLNTATLKLKFYVEEVSRPYYVILSHTWGEDEVSFQEIQNLTSEIYSRQGYKKIVRCCKQAESNGFEYVWIDTCCIDKANSVELSEAINSMYGWYHSAAECYAYLSDVNTPTNGERFKKSRWFTRGWTLQELVAPPSIIFYDSRWREIGTKESLCQIISRVTAVPAKVLLERDFDDCSIAQKMSWASTRETTRTEDIAYCLLGIFGISMPLIYGEGQRSFHRLQLEIIKASNDQSLFAWSSEKKRAHYFHWSPFAESPKEFAKCGDIKRMPEDMYREYFQHQFGIPYSMTNVGLEISLPVTKFTVDEAANNHRVWNPSGKVGFLNCARWKNGKQISIGIMLAKQLKSEIWYRILPYELHEEVHDIVTPSIKPDLDPPERLLIYSSPCDPYFDNKFLRHNADNHDKVKSILIRCSGLDLVAERFGKHQYHTSIDVRMMLFDVPQNNQTLMITLGMGYTDTRACHWIHLLEENINVKKSFEIVKEVQGNGEPIIRQDRVVRRLAGRTQINLAFKKVLHQGSPRYMVDIFISVI